MNYTVVWSEMTAEERREYRRQQARALDAVPPMPPEWKPSGPVCWRCKGMGEVPTPFGGDPDRGVPENDTCPECRGDGKGKWE